MSSKTVSDRKFHLKPFSLSHAQSTQRVGMDSLLLGAWTDASNVKQALDIGAGCGILSLMLASKCDARITAIELDRESVLEAQQNFISSPFYKRLHIVHEDFNNFSTGSAETFQLIIANPPFFINDLKSPIQKKSLARHTDTLSYEQLIQGAEKLLTSNGRFCLVLPYQESHKFIDLAENISDFSLTRQLIIFPRRGESPNRVNLQFELKKPVQREVEKLVIREEDGHFSKEYKMMLSFFLIGQ